MVLKPIARGITCLEGQRLFAYYSITLFNIRSELSRLSVDGNLKYAKPLLNAVTSGFEKRFKDVMDLNNVSSVPLYLSMLSHPGFKINFIPEMKKHSTAIEYLTKCKGMMLKAIESIDLEEEESSKNMSPAESNTAYDGQIPCDGGSYFFPFFPPSSIKVRIHI